MLGKSNAAQDSTVAVNIDAGLQFSSSIGAFTLGGLSGANNFALADSGGAPVTLSVGNNNASTSYSGIMSGPGSLTKIGNGTLTLSGANTFMGNVVINAGSLQLSNSNALEGANVSADIFLHFGPSIGIFTLGGLNGGSSAFTPVPLSDTSGAPVTLLIGNNNTSTTFSTPLSGAGALTKIGTGTLTLSGANSYSGGTTVSAGTLGLTGANTFTGPIAVNGGLLLLGNSNASQKSTVTVNLDGGLAFSPSIGTFNVAGLSGANAFALADTGGGSVTLSVGGTNASSVYSGAMSGVGSLTKAGTGTLTLAGANTFTGSTTVNAGVVQLGNSNALQNSSVVLNINAGLTFRPSIGTFTIGSLAGFNATSGGFSLTDTSGAPITLQVGNNNPNPTFYYGSLSGTGAITKVGSSTLYLGDTGTYTGLTTIDAGTLVVGGAAQDSTVVVNVTNGLTSGFTIGGLAGGANFALTDILGRAETLTVGNNNANTTYSGSMSGAGSLTKIGSGSLILTGSNAFSGGISVNAGSLILSAANSFSGLTAISGGSLQLNDPNAAQNCTIAPDANGGLTFGPAIGAFTIGGLGRSAFNQTASGNFALSDTSGAPVALQVGNDNANTTYSGVMSGAGSLTKIGTGTLTLKGANSFTGDTAINAGAIQLGVVNALQNSTVVVNVDNGLTFSSLGSSATFTIGGLSGANNLSLGVVSNIGAALRIGSDNASTVFSGIISDLNLSGGSVTKVGTGILSLAGTNTYSSPTSVISGSVQLANALALQHSPTAVNVDGGLTFLPGIGTFTIGGLSGAGNIALMDLAGGTVNLRVNSSNFSGAAYSGVMSGSGSLTEVGTGGIILGGANTFIGQTTIAAGILQLTNGNALQNSTVVIGGGQLFFNTSFPAASNYTLGGLAGSGSLGLRDEGGGFFLNLNVGNNNADTTFAGSFSNIGSMGELNKIGTGTLTLTGINSSFVSIRGGAVQLGSADTLSNAGVGVSVDGGLRFSPGIGAFSIATLSGANNFSLTDTTGIPWRCRLLTPAVLARRRIPAQ